MKLLWVEDDVELAKIMAGRLAFSADGTNFEARIATSMKEASRAIESAKFDAVFVDLMLSHWTDSKFSSEASSPPLLEMLRTSNPNTKIIAYSNYFDSLGDADLRQQFNADFVFTKRPGNRDVGDQLAEVLRDFLPPANSEKERLEPSLIIPARQSIVTINTRLAGIFRKDPELLKTIRLMRRTV